VDIIEVINLKRIRFFNMYGRMKNVYRILVEKPEGEKQLAN
jgi:hypothetical protein